MNINVLRYKISKRIHLLIGDRKYKTYADAMTNCLSKGYDNPAIVSLTTKKGLSYRQHIETCVTPHISDLNVFPLLALINNLSEKKDPINVIDFGGGDGAHYLQLRQLLNKNIGLKWQVVETPEMVKNMRVFTTNELSFSERLCQVIQNTPQIDILYTSGTLQYTSNLYDYIERMVNSNADFLVFNRLSLTINTDDVITIQRSLLSWHGARVVTDVKFVDKEVRYPHTNISIKKFEEMIQKKYAIVCTYDDDTGVKKVLNETIIGRSYILKKI
jgi:putative methyltransferase (TIGR04325 family)